MSKLFTTLMKVTFGFLLICSNTQAGKYDEVWVQEIKPVTRCKDCSTCPVDTLKTGVCGEIYAEGLLRTKGFDVSQAQHNDSGLSGHGIDLIAFKDSVVDVDGRRKPLIIFHESKSSASSNVSAASFKHKLGNPSSGMQGSRTWLNDALEKMKRSTKPGIPALAKKVTDALKDGAYFLRTGNMRVDVGEGRTHRAHVQFYVLHKI